MFEFGSRRGLARLLTAIQRHDHVYCHARAKVFGQRVCRNDGYFSARWPTWYKRRRQSNTPEADDVAKVDPSKAMIAMTKTASYAKPCASRYTAWLVTLFAAIGLLPATSNAQILKNEVAVFAALDKVTARISRLEIELDQTVRFGALKVTPRVCNSRPPTEPPKTTSFVEVDEIKLDGTKRRIFTGWMFAESPGLHAVEHPVFDVWLTGCAGTREGQLASQTDDGLDRSVSTETNTTRRKRRSLR